MKSKWIALFAAYLCVVAGVYLWDGRGSFERVVPYSHPGTFSEMKEPTTLESTTEAKAVTQNNAARQMTEPILTETTDTTDPTEPIVYPLELNSVTFEELCGIPGIGEAIAGAICDYRSWLGAFRNMSQLLEINGIGEKRFELLKGYLYLEVEIFEPEEIRPTQNTFPAERSIPEPEPPNIPVLNLNTATKEQMMQLPGCEAWLAENILYLRDELIHLFHNPLEITLAEGVTDELYLLWSPYLAVDDEGGTQLPPE